MIILGKAPALSRDTVWNELLEAGLATEGYPTVLIIKVKLSKISATLQSHATLTKHHHHVGVTRRLV